MSVLNERGLREGLAALVDIKRTVQTACREAQRKAGEAEAQLLAMQKIEGFVDIQIANMRAELTQLEREKEEQK